MMSTLLSLGLFLAGVGVLRRSFLGAVFLTGASAYVLVAGGL